MSDFLWHHGLQHARFPCSSPSPGVCLYPCALSWWCCLTISSSATPFSLAFHFPQHQGLFQWVGSLHQVVKVLEFQSQHQSFQWLFGVDFLYYRLLWLPCSPRDFQESSSALPYSRTPHYPEISLLGIYPKKKEKKTNSKRYMNSNIYRHYLQLPRDGSDLSVHQQMNG